MIECHDKYGNSSTKCYSLYGDNEAPTLTPCSGTVYESTGSDNVNGPYKLYWAPSDGKAKFEVNDASGVKFYSFYGSGNELVVGNEAGIVELPGSEDGIYYQYELLDIFGNRFSGTGGNAYTAKIKVQIDKTLPECETEKKCVGIAYPSIGPASGMELHTESYYKDLAYTEISVTENESGLKENGIYFLDSTIERYKIDGDTEWTECSSGTNVIKIKAGTKYVSKKICIYFKPPVDVSSYSVLLCIEDLCGNKKAVRLKTEFYSEMMWFDNYAPYMFYNDQNNFVEVTNGVMTEAYATKVVVTVTDSSQPTTVKIKNGDRSGTGLYEITGMPTGNGITYTEDRSTTTQVLNYRTYTFPAGYTTPGIVDITLIDRLGNERTVKFQIKQ